MSMRTKQARLTTEEFHELKWLVGSVLCLLSLWALTALELDSGLYLVVGIVAICVALIKPKWIAAIPPLVWRIAEPAILLVTVVDFSFGFINFFPPLMRLVILLLLFRALAPRTRRQDLQLLLLCLFGLVVSGALTVSLLFAVQMLLFTPVAMTLLFVICLLDRGEQVERYQPNWEDFSWKRLVRRVWLVVDIRVLGLGALLFAFVVTASSVFFVLIPRFNLERAIPFLQLQTKPKSGFSDQVKFGSDAEITEDNSIALQIDVPGLDAIRATPYWRILALDQYRDGTFSLSDKMRESVETDRLRELSAWQYWEVPLQQQQGQVWTFYFEGGVSQYLPLPGAFHSMRFPGLQDLQLLPHLHVIGLNAVPQNTFSYEIKDIFWDVWAPASAAENDAYLGATNDFGVLNSEEEEGHFAYENLKLNLDLPDRKHLSDLNRSLTAGGVDLSAADYSELVTSHLRQNFRYSLQPDGGGGADDPVVSWLAEGRFGHCELFAGAFVLLARDAGYPARMVVGFAGGSWNAVEEFFVVRNSDAHAWVEIYDLQSQAWLRVDPTPGASANDPEVSLPASFEVETGLRAWIDSLRIQWYRRIVNFDQKDQVELATSMLDMGDQLVAALSARFKEIGTTFKEWIALPFGRGSFVRGALLIGLGVICFVLWRTRYQCMQLLFRLVKRAPAMSPTRREASRQLAQIRGRMAELNAAEPQLEMLRNSLHELQALRFGPDVSTDEAKVIFAKAKRALKQPRA